MMLNGINVIRCSEALERVGPKKVLVPKRWMKGNYHARVQKKWIKRYGYEMKPAAYQTPHGILCHPAIYEQLIQQIEPRQPIHYH